MKDPKHVPLDIAASAYWKEEAKKCIEARDQAKERLNEVNKKLAELEAQGSLSEHLNKFIRDIPYEIKDLPVHDWIMDKVCDIENTNHIPVRMECKAKFIRLLRDMGMSIFSPASHAAKTEEGCMGIIDSIGLPVYLNNSLEKKIRLFVKPISLKPFEFPCAPPKQDFKEEISYAIDAIFSSLGSCYPVSSFIVSDISDRNVACRILVRDVKEFGGKIEEIALSLLKELKANNAIAIAYPQVFIAPDPKHLRYDVSISIPFSSDDEVHADFIVTENKS